MSVRLRIEAIQEIPGNETCADCLAANPQWASRLLLEEDQSVTVLVCNTCAIHHHFELGEKRCRIKYLQFYHEWTNHELEILEVTGNQVVKKVYEATLSPFDYAYYYKSLVTCPLTEERRQGKFIKLKYKKKEFLDRSGLTVLLQQIHGPRELESSQNDVQEPIPCAPVMARSSSASAVSKRSVCLPSPRKILTNSRERMPRSPLNLFSFTPEEFQQRNNMAIRHNSNHPPPTRLVKNSRKVLQTMVSERSMNSLSMASTITGTSRSSTGGDTGLEDLFGTMIQAVMEVDEEASIASKDIEIHPSSSHSELDEPKMPPWWRPSQQKLWHSDPYMKFDLDDGENENSDDEDEEIISVLQESNRSNLLEKREDDIPRRTERRQSDPLVLFVPPMSEEEASQTREATTMQRSKSHRRRQSDPLVASLLGLPKENASSTKRVPEAGRRSSSQPKRRQVRQTPRRSSKGRSVDRSTRKEEDAPLRRVKTDPKVAKSSNRRMTISRTERRTDKEQSNEPGLRRTQTDSTKSRKKPQSGELYSSSQQSKRVPRKDRVQTKPRTFTESETESKGEFGPSRTDPKPRKRSSSRSSLTRRERANGEYRRSPSPQLRRIQTDPKPLSRASIRSPSRRASRRQSAADRPKSSSKDRTRKRSQSKGAKRRDGNASPSSNYADDNGR